MRLATTRNVLRFAHKVSTVLHRLFMWRSRFAKVKTIFSRLKLEKEALGGYLRKKNIYFVNIYYRDDVRVPCVGHKGLSKTNRITPVSNNKNIQIKHLLIKLVLNASRSK